MLCNSIRVVARPLITKKGERRAADLKTWYSFSVGSSSEVVIKAAFKKTRLNSELGSRVMIFNACESQC